MAQKVKDPNKFMPSLASAHVATGAFSLSLKGLESPDKLAAALIMTKTTAHYLEIVEPALLVTSARLMVSTK